MASSAARSVDQKVRMHEKSADPNQVVLEPKGADANGVRNQLPELRDSVQSDEQFPSNGYSAEDERDALMQEKLKTQIDPVQHPGVTPFGVLQAKDSDFEWLRKKRESEAYANFSAWFAQNFDKMSPVQKQEAKRLFPRFYQERLEQLDRTIALQGKLAKLKLLGIEDKDDLLLQYAAEAGYIDADPLEHILHPERAKAQADRAQRQTRYQRGLFNPNRLLRGDWGDSKRKANADAIFSKRTASATPAYDLGTTRGFSAAGALNDQTERIAGSQEQYNFLQQFL